MAKLNNKNVYLFRRWGAQIDDKSALRNVWDGGYINDNSIYVEWKIQDIKDTFKTVRAVPQSGQTLYFGKTSKFPRFKLTGSNFKRCIKSEKADLFIIGCIDGREYDYDYLIEDEINYYLIRNDALQNIRSYNPSTKSQFLKDPIEYIKTNLLFGGNIISERQKVTVCLFEGETAIDVINIMNGTYKNVATDTDLDKAINTGLDAITEEDLRSITDLLDSPDQSSQAIGLKMLGAYNINDIPLTIRTLLGFRNYLGQLPEWKSVGVKNMLTTINWDDFGRFPDYVRPIIEPAWKKQKYTEQDTNLCRQVYVDLIKKQLADKIKQLEGMEILNTFGIKITYDVS